MKKILTTLAIAIAISASAQTTPLWMRHCAISPNGESIVFSYKGDIFCVSTEGGTARQLTSNPAYDAHPIWSPDGQKIAFTSNREGSLDIYIMDKNGGEPRRLTTDSGNEVPMAFLNDEQILFNANIMPTAKSIYFASSSFPQTYTIDANGGRPRLYSPVPMQDISVNPTSGELLFHDKKGYEDEFRKHHQSPIARDIWLNSSDKFKKLTNFHGEDRTPRWANDRKSFYYLSEEDGTFNIYKRQVANTQKQQITRHKNHPVRFLTVAQNGTLCYGYDGEVYTTRDGEEPRRVNINIIADKSDKDLIRQTKTSGATEILLSPNGKEIAFVMHGDVYVTSIDYTTTKQVTDTPEQERSISFAPDGKSIVYASERNGLWQIYQTRIKNNEEKTFTYASDLEEERLTQSDQTSFLPKFSPDGKCIAYFENRSTLKVMDLKSKNTHTALDGKYIFSYQDGDLWFQWSPDSRWLLTPYIGFGGWNNTDIALVSADGKGEVYDLTESGYGDANAKWVLGGKAMIFASDRAGYRSHGSWGTEDDVYIMFFDQDAYERFTMTKEEKELIDKEKEEKRKEAAGKKEEKKAAEKKKQQKTTEKERLKFDLENCRDRIVRLTANSSRLADALLSPGGDTLYYQARFEGGFDLWRHDLRERKTEIVMKNIGSGEMFADKAFKNIFIGTPRGIKKVEIANGKSKNIEFEARFNYKPYEERAYMFDHVWRQVKDKFYVENMHNVDWEYYRKAYERFLPHINNGYDFSEMLSEMLGELNASHTGARFNGEGASLKTACLGVFLDNGYEGDGLKIEEVIKNSPFAQKNTGVTSGCIIEKIDGERILRDQDYNHLLDGKAGKPVRFTVFNPNGKKRFDVTIRPISKGEQQELLYKRWVDRNREMVKQLSGGRIAYVHVQAMNSPSFRTVFSELLSNENRQKDAVIVDERHNGGGWLHDDLCTLLSGKQYQSFVPHGKYVGYDPWNKWVKPSCVLMCEDDYSNGHGFPMVYKELGIGKLVGTPVAGTMTAVWWETLIDNRLVYGIPQVGCVDMRGNYGENQQLNPDIEVYNSPEDYLSGKDRQLEEAVRLMMKHK